jgi:hypothetical protein
MERKGERISGSKYFRDFCSLCKDPIRVSNTHVANICDACVGHRLPPGRPSLTKGDTSPGWDDAVRCLEDHPTGP